jgi:hypothetical protein
MVWSTTTAVEEFLAVRSRGLAGTAPLRVGLRGRKRSGDGPSGLPPEAYTRMIFLADNPDPERVS